jgi:hypothetical protein
MRKPAGITITATLAASLAVAQDADIDISKT